MYGPFLRPSPVPAAPSPDVGHQVPSPCNGHSPGASWAGSRVPPASGSGAQETPQHLPQQQGAGSKLGAVHGRIALAVTSSFQFSLVRLKVSGFFQASVGSPSSRLPSHLATQPGYMEFCSTDEHRGGPTAFPRVNQSYIFVFMMQHPARGLQTRYVLSRLPQCGLHVVCYECAWERQVGHVNGRRDMSHNGAGAGGRGR